jgi:hypothetical protein
LKKNGKIKMKIKGEISGFAVLTEANYSQLN